MQLCFSDQVAQTLFCCHAKLIQAYGNRLAKLICCRLAVLQATARIGDLPRSPPVDFQIGKNGDLSVAVGRGHRLMFRATPGSAPGKKNLESITDIQIYGLIPVAPAKET